MNYANVVKKPELVNWLDFNRSPWRKKKSSPSLNSNDSCGKGWPPYKLAVAI